MVNKLILLRIIKDNQPVGVHGIDMAFHDVVDFGTMWQPYMTELLEEKLVIHSEGGYRATENGEQYLHEHSEKI